MIILFLDLLNINYYIHVFSLEILHSWCVKSDRYKVMRSSHKILKSLRTPHQWLWCQGARKLGSKTNVVWLGDLYTSRWKRCKKYIILSFNGLIKFKFVWMESLIYIGWLIKGGFIFILWLQVVLHQNRSKIWGYCFKFHQSKYAQFFFYRDINTHRSNILERAC